MGTDPKTSLEPVKAREAKIKPTRKARFAARVTYANVMATLAFFFAVSGGAAYATHLVVNGSDVVDESLTGADVRGKPGTSSTPAVNGSLDGHDIWGQAANAANGTPYVNGSLTGHDIAEGTIRNVDIATDAINSAKVLDGSLTGNDVNESTLGKVPNADQLDGRDSAEFVQGAGRTKHEGAFVTPGATFVWNDDLFILWVDCPSNLANDPTVGFQNRTDNLAWVFSDNGSGSPTFRELTPFPGPGSYFTQPAAAGGEEITFRVGVIGHTVDISYYSVNRAGFDCYVSETAHVYS